MRVRGPRADDLRLPRARARRGGHVLRDRGRRRACLPDVHARRRDPAEGPRARELGGGRQGPEPLEDGALNIVVVGGGPTGVESAGALAELYRGDFARDYPGIPQEKARIVLVEAGAEIFAMFKPNLRDVRERGAREADGRGRHRRTRRSRSRRPASRSSRATVIAAHTLVWGAGLQGNQLVQSLGLELRARQPDRRRARAHGRGSSRRCSPSATSPRSPTRRREQVLPQLGSVALQSGEHAGETIARRVAGKEPKPFKYRDKGTMATIGRGAAVVQMLGGRTMKGVKAQARLGRRAPRAPADERGSREGDRRLGRCGADAPAHRPDHV